MQKYTVTTGDIKVAREIMDGPLSGQWTQQSPGDVAAILARHRGEAFDRASALGEHRLRFLIGRTLDATQAWLSCMEEVGRVQAYKAAIDVMWPAVEKTNALLDTIKQM